MSSVLDFSNLMREQSTTETVESRSATERFEPYRQRRKTRSFYTRCFGLCEVFVEFDGVIAEWAITRNSDGFTLWMGRVNITYSTTYEYLGEYDGDVRTRNQWDYEGGDGAED